VIAGVVSYMFLCWWRGRGGFAGLVSLASSPYSSERFVKLNLVGCLLGQ